MGNVIKKYLLKKSVLLGMCLLTVLFLPCLVSADTYTYDGTPAFTVTYPSSLQNDPEPMNYELVKKVKHPSGCPTVEISVLDIPEGTKIEDIGKYYDILLQESSMSETDILSDKMTTLPDGTPAHEFIVNWMWEGWFKIQTVLISAYKDGKWVYVAVHDNQVPLEKVKKEIVMSLTFK